MCMNEDFVYCVDPGTLMWWWIKVSVGRRQYKCMNSICRITGPLSHPLLAEDKVDSTLFLKFPYETQDD